MNVGSNSFDQWFYAWTLAVPFFHIAGLVITWQYPEYFIFWGIISLLAYGLLLKMIINSIDHLPWLIGYANWVTTLRLLILHVLFLFQDGFNELILLSGFLIVLISDGLDGYLARKYNQETVEGGALDNETDALMTLFLTWIHVSNQRIPEWLLLPGGLRYLYVWIIHFLPVTKAKELLPRKVRATFSVIFVISLLFPFVFNMAMVSFMISITGSLIILSFLMSISLRVFSPDKVE